MKCEIRKQLMEYAEKEYKEFSQGLNPGTENMLGVRLPELRKIAKQIAKEDWENALEEDDIYFEETMLRGMVISYAVKDLEKALPYIEAFIPRVDCWSICDSVFMGMNVLQKDRTRTWEFIQPYSNSDKEFELRVAMIIMMQHLLKCDEKGNKISRLRVVEKQSLENKEEKAGLYIKRILKYMNRPFIEGYYASMAASWLLAECFCIYPYHTMQFIRKNKMDRITFNKGIQKIIESRIPTDEVKICLKALKKKS